MRMPRLRFTIWRMMVTVAIVGMLFAIAIAYRRAAFFRERARLHSNAAWLHSIFALEEMALACGEAERCRGANIVGFKDESQREWEIASRHWDLSWMYEAAVWQPWLSLAPEPPDPE